LLGFWLAVFVAFLAVSPGRMTFETKLGVALAPGKFIDDLGQLWHDQAGFGGIADQYIGYAFPSLPYYLLMDLLHVPVWFAERLWLSLIVSTAFWGALRLAERLRVGTPASRLVGAMCYALWPTFTIIIGSTSAAAMPGAVLPWVLLPLTRADLTARRAATRSALVIPFMGGVNAASTLASLLPVLLYVLSRPAGPRKRSLMGWWSAGVALATCWWVIPLLLLGFYGEDFMPYVEQASTTTGTMSATELLRGAGNWVAYLNFGHPWLPAGRTVATGVITVLGSAFAAALGLAGLARRDLPERRWLLMIVLSVLLITLAGYGGHLGAHFFHETMQAWLNGWLRPFRNVYKFQPGLALTLSFGLAHITGRAATYSLRPASTKGKRARRASTAVVGPGGARLLPVIAALCVLPGLTWPYLNGSILQPGSFRQLPSHWSQAADWLEKYAPDNRALVVPATAHGIYTWGSPIDQPLDVLAKSRWAQRDFVPFGTPGSRRAMDAVEQALMTGSQVPGLRDYLTRAGLWDVVVRNDLDPDQIGYVPPQIVKKTLESSGYRKVAGFGPLVTAGRIPKGTPVEIQALFPRLQAVEIYEPAGAAPGERPKQVAVKPVADTAVVSGGPEALLQLSADQGMRKRPAVLTGDPHPGVEKPSLQVAADGMRRADTRFGLVNHNTSYTYAAGERNASGNYQDAGAEPKQLLPTTGVEHQTTAVLRGAKKVTASSSGHWLFHLPQYDPVNAFDGNPDTAWADGSAGRRSGGLLAPVAGGSGRGEPDDQWLRIDFTSPTQIPSAISVKPLPAGDGTRSVPTRIRVETDKGSVDSSLETDGERQTVRAPAGEAEWLRIKILDVQESRPGLPGAGFSEVSIPGVRVTKLLRLPTDSGSTGAEAGKNVLSFHRDMHTGALWSGSEQNGLNRQFDTAEGASGEYRLKAQALPVAGDELDVILNRLSPESRSRITATADSTSATSPSLSARNLVDGDWLTGWVAGDKPVIHLKWPQKRPIDQIIFQAAGGISARPQEVQITSPYGSTTAGVDKNGQARFDPITTDRLDITISRTAPVTIYNPIADSKLRLPVGLSEVYVPALADLIAPAPDPDKRFTLPCGEGPTITVDGRQYETAASGLVRDLTQGRPVDVQLCNPKGEEPRKAKGKTKSKGGTRAMGPAATIGLSAGRHVLESADSGSLALTDLTLTRGNPQQLPTTGTRPVTTNDWLGDRRSVTVGTGRASYLQIYENHNPGWKATLNGKELKPVRIDGWQQGWLIPAGQGGTVALEYEPAKLYEGGLIAGVAGPMVLAALAFGRRRAGTAPARRARRAREDPAASAPAAPGRQLGLFTLGGVVFVISPFLGGIVPALAAVARRRSAALALIAAVAMAGAGVVAAVGAAGLGGGAFGATAQVLALVAVAAAVVTPDTAGDAPVSGTTGTRGNRRPTRKSEPPPARETGVAGQTAELPLVAADHALTAESGAGDIAPYPEADALPAPEPAPVQGEATFPGLVGMADAPGPREPAPAPSEPWHQGLDTPDRGWPAGAPGVPATPGPEALPHGSWSGMPYDVGPGPEGTPWGEGADAPGGRPYVDGLAPDLRMGMPHAQVNDRSPDEAAATAPGAPPPGLNPGPRLLDAGDGTEITVGPVLPGSTDPANPWPLIHRWG